MIPYSATQGYSTLLDRLSVDALTELDGVMSSVAVESPVVQQEALMELLPVLGNQYVGASSLVTAQFFTELQEMNGVRNPIEAELLDAIEVKRWHALAGWGAGRSVFEQGGAALVYSLLSGGLTKVLTESAADTMVGNAAAQGGMRSQRVPRTGCCAFCGLLASRFAGYSTQAAAGTVGGRGKPVGSHKLAKGVRARGARAIGEDFHDFCRCRIVVVTGSNEVELQSTADKYLDSYSSASKQATSGRELRHVESKAPDGSLSRKYHWVDAEGKKRTSKDFTSDILTAMRQDLGVK